MGKDREIVGANGTERSTITTTSTMHEYEHEHHAAPSQSSSVSSSSDNTTATKADIRQCEHRRTRDTKDERVEVPCKPSQERVGEVERLVVCHDGRTQSKHVPCHRDLASNKHGRVFREVLISMLCAPCLHYGV